MTLPGLVFLVILTSSDAKLAADHPDPECGDCNENEPWRPLFRPSQIIHSEFPEHAQYRSQEQGQYPAHDSYRSQEQAHQQYTSQEQGQYPAPEQYSSHEQAHYPVHVHSSQEHVQYNSQEHRVDEAPHTVSLTRGHGSREVAGIDSQVRTYSSQGKHRLEWDHYGDVSHVTTVTYNSLEDRTGHNSGEDEPYQPVNPAHQAPPNSVEAVRTSGEDLSGNEQEGREPGHTSDDVPELDVSAKSQEGGFFDDGSFFDEKISPPTNHFPEDFDISKTPSFFHGAHESSNSIEVKSSHEGLGLFRKPVATSYSSFSSIFTRPRLVPKQPKDLLHPDINFNDVTNYIKSQIRSPVRHRQLFKDRNVTNQYLVHEPQQEEPAVLRITHVTPASPDGRSILPSPFVPLDHPVYRYVKKHGGLLHHYRRQPLSRASSLRWQDVHPELRNKFPFKHLQPHVRVENHETVVHHVVPTKDPLDNFWKESRKMEHLKPPPLGQTLYFYKKKPNPIDFKKIARREGQDIVYIIKRKGLS